MIFEVIRLPLRLLIFFYSTMKAIIVLLKKNFRNFQAIKIDKVFYLSLAADTSQT